MNAEEWEDEAYARLSKALRVSPEKLRRKSEEMREGLRREYEAKDPGYAFGLFKLMHIWQTTGRASLKLTKEQVHVIYRALAFMISLHLPSTFKTLREPYEAILVGDAVLRLMTDKSRDASTRLASLTGVVENLSIMMLIEEQIHDCQTWPCVVELSGYGLTAVSSALAGQATIEYLPGSPILELSQATLKIVDDAIVAAALDSPFCE